MPSPARDTTDITGGHTCACPSVRGSSGPGNVVSCWGGEGQGHLVEGPLEPRWALEDQSLSPRGWAGLSPTCARVQRGLASPCGSLLPGCRDPRGLGSRCLLSRWWPGSRALRVPRAPPTSIRKKGPSRAASCSLCPLCPLPCFVSWPVPGGCAHRSWMTPMRTTSTWVRDPFPPVTQAATPAGAQVPFHGSLSFPVQLGPSAPCRRPHPGSEQAVEGVLAETFRICFPSVCKSSSTPPACCVLCCCRHRGLCGK